MDQGTPGALPSPDLSGGGMAAWSAVPTALTGGRGHFGCLLP